MVSKNIFISFQYHKELCVMAASLHYGRKLYKHCHFHVSLSILPAQNCGCLLYLTSCLFLKEDSKPSPIFTVCFLHVDLATTYNFSMQTLDTVQIDCFVLPAVYCYNFNTTDQIRLYSIQVYSTISFFHLLDVEVIKRCLRKMKTSQVFTQLITITVCTL